MVCSKWPKDHLCKIWGENVCSGARYGCECNVLRDGGIRVIPTGVLSDSLIIMLNQMKTAIFEIRISRIW